MSRPERGRAGRAGQVAVQESQRFPTGQETVWETFVFLTLSRDKDKGSLVEAMVAAHNHRVQAIVTMDL